jgi:hypothetical protein
LEARVGVVHAHPSPHASPFLLYLCLHSLLKPSPTTTQNHIISSLPRSSRLHSLSFWKKNRLQLTFYFILFFFKHSITNQQTTDKCAAIRCVPGFKCDSLTGLCIKEGGVISVSTASAPPEGATSTTVTPTATGNSTVTATATATQTAPAKNGAVGLNDGGAAAAVAALMGVASLFL